MQDAPFEPCPTNAKSPDFRPAGLSLCSGTAWPLGQCCLPLAEALLKPSLYICVHLIQFVSTVTEPRGPLSRYQLHGCLHLSKLLASGLCLV